MKSTGIILAGGRGSRMNSDIPKQYINVCGRPLLSYTIEAFEMSMIDEIILVAGEGDEEYCRTQIVEKGSFLKVSAIVTGGGERYDSVYNGLCACKDTDLVLIHDGARCLVSPELINKMLKELGRRRVCIAAVPVKDTVKIVGEDGRVKETPNRNFLWSVQTPQGFYYEDLITANERMYKAMDEGNELCDWVTDDAMIMERFSDTPVYIMEGDYSNIKVTTPDDLKTVELILNERKLKKKRKSC